MLQKESFFVKLEMEKFYLRSDSVLRQIAMLDLAELRNNQGDIHHPDRFLVVVPF